MIAAYRRSPEFLELADRTRRDYQKVFDYLKPLDCDPLVSITSAYVIEIRDAAFQAHQASPFHDRLVPPIMACVEGDMDLQMLDWRS